MVCLFPIDRNFGEQTLEGMAIILFVRWLLFALGVFLFSLLAFIVIATFLTAMKGLWWLILFGATFVAPFSALLIRDLMLVRGAALHWPVNRIKTMGIISKLPWCAVISLPGFWLKEGFSDAQTTMDWFLLMVFFLNGLGLAVYLVYFILVLSIFRLPSWLTLLAFIASSGMFWHALQAETSKGADKAFQFSIPTRKVSAP